MNTVSETRLSGHWLITARIVWIVLVLSMLGMFVAGLPFYIKLLQKGCHDVATCTINGAVTPQALQTLQTIGLSPSLYVTYSLVLIIAMMVVWTIVALLILWRRSDDWLALLAAFALVTFNFDGHYGPHTLLGQASSLWELPIQFVNFVQAVSPVLFFLLFPDGQFVPRPMRWVALSFLLLQALSFFPPPTSPFNATTWPTWLKGLLDISFSGGIIFAQIYRYRYASNPLKRQQIKWGGFGIAVALAGFIGLVLLYLFLPSFTQTVHFSLLTDTAFRLFLLPIPICIGVAILRYRLWDIDLIINRTLIYSLLTLSIFGIYMLVVNFLGILLQAQGNFFITLSATGLVAVLFQPLRDRLQRLINHLMFGDRDTPYQAIVRLGQRLETTLAPDAVLPTIVETVAHALKLPYVAVHVKQDDKMSVVASFGRAQEALTCLQLFHQGDLVGELLLAPRAPGEAFSSADRKLLEDLARQVGIAVHSVNLTQNLQRLARELQHSRTALVTAREEERRRLRRDLHDGLGSTLASLNWRAGALRLALAHDLKVADELVTEQQEIIRSTIVDIRRLVYDLRPPSLDELGLVGAIRERAAEAMMLAMGGTDCKSSPGLSITLQAPQDLPPLPAAIEVAAYRIVQEALTNVVRHAQAATCQVELRFEEEVLHIEVRDDGVGINVRQQGGIGLLSMRERATEVGGRWSIHPGGKGGTHISADLPLLTERTNL